MRATRSKTTSVSFALVVFLLGGNLACHRTESAQADSVDRPGDNPSAAPPLVRWNGGDRYTYRVELSSSSRNESSPNVVAFTATAALRVRPQVAAGGTEFFAELLDVSVQAVGDSGAPLPRDLQEDLAAPWGFELVDGSFRAVRARATTSPFAIGILNTLAAGLQSPGAATDGGAWDHKEVDGSGTYRAHYAAGAQSGELTRVKTDYEGRSVGRLNMSPSVVASQGTLRLHGVDLFSVQTHDELEGNLTAASKVRSTTDLALTLVEHTPGAPQADWAALRGSTVVLQPGQVPPQQHADPYDLELAANVTFPQVLAEAEKESTPAPGSSANPMASSAPDEETARAREKTFSSLVALLRTRPGSVRLAAAAIDKGSPARMVLIDALGAAATPESLDAIIAYAKRPTTPDPIRKKAAFALIRTPRPSAATVDALISMLGDKRLGSFAVVGLGTYSRLLRQAGDEAQASRAIDAVVPLLDTTQDRKQLVDVLPGIANSGDGRAFGRVRPLVDDADESIRAAAVDAIRLMPNPEVDGLLAARMAPNEKVPVRLEAIDAARARGAHEPLIAAVRNAATGATDSESRLAAVQLLQRWLPDRPEVRSTLEQVARDDAREAVRRAAKAALGT
jgi:hypothetical protein